MNCEKCQELLSDFLDGALSREEQATLSAHVEECLSCYTTHDELSSIVNFCREHRGEYEAPPNAQALWLRIQNTIEADGSRKAVSGPARSGEREYWWTRWLNRSWELSLSQMAMAVSAIAVAVALATAFGLHQSQSVQADLTTKATAKNSAAMPAVQGLTNLPIRGISQEIDYWQQRVDERKTRWSQQRRADFDLNLRVINEAVEDRLKDLRENPHDDVTEEMLNAVLNNKVELLREFADL
ncbi:MAG TPA: zf-HC2 domain-containing protein [Pyrinomonadaceae bacterium]|jgi:hypothetical protein